MSIRLAVLVASALLSLIGSSATIGAEGYQMQWSRQLPLRAGAWREVGRMPSDRTYVPGAGGKIVVVGAEHNGAAIAFDAATGDEQWRFYTAAPLRVGPVVDDERVYVASGDGQLYVLDHAGKLLWKFRGGPSERWVIGHDRLISAWPAAARPVLHAGIIYYQAGYWPVDGVYVHALDAATGKLRWSSASLPTRPIGELRVDGEKLVVDATNGSAVLRLTDGAVLADKVVKPAPPVLPETPGASGAKAQAGDSIFVCADNAMLYGFAQRAAEPKKHVAVAATNTADDYELTKKILAAAGDDGGYCLLVGAGGVELIAGLVSSSKRSVVVVDADAAKIDAARARLDAQGLFNTHRLSLIAADPTTVDLPPYFASLIVLAGVEPHANIERSLRPFGGQLVQLGGNELKITKCEGAPAGSDSWAQEFHDAANTLASRDKLVKAPLGLLWYGGDAGDPRFYFDGNADHQSGDGLNPQPVSAEIVDGRMFLQGPGVLCAVDIYNGRLLWEVPLPKVYLFGGGGGGLGIHSKKHPKPWEVAAALAAEVSVTHRCRPSGFNMVSTPDGVYLAVDQHIRRVDPATGKTISEFPIPAEIAKGVELCWGGIREEQGILLATLFRPQDLIDAQAGHDGNGSDWAGDRMPMTYLVALDRQTGKLLWHRAAKWGFINRSGICAGGGRVYCVDLLLPGVMAKMQEAERMFTDAPPALLALDLQTGKELWKFDLDVMVQNIAYAAHRDWLLVPNRNLRVWEGGKWVDKATDIRRGASDKNRAGKMRALSAKDGKILWEVAESEYSTPLVVLGDLLIDRSGLSFNLTDGKRNERVNPLTGEEELWSFRKGGCNHLVACDNLITWRCAFYDLATGGGSMSLTGMDAGCTPTLLPAGGVLNIPNFGTHHKRHRMTAMALVHRPQNDVWTRFAETQPLVTKPLVRGGFNFGAPGDRVAEDGTVWLAVDPRKREGVTIEPAEAAWFQAAPASTAAFVTASGVVGATKLTVPVLVGGKPKPDGAKRNYEVRLHFAEPRPLAAGERVFSVQLEGETVLSDFDIAREATGSGQPVVKAFNIEVTDALDIAFTATSGQPLLCGVELRAK